MTQKFLSPSHCHKIFFEEQTLLKKTQLNSTCSKIQSLNNQEKGGKNR